MRDTACPALPRRCGGFPAHGRRAFTLMELILIVAILAATVTIIVPRLAGFFRGRVMDSETRQMISLIRFGQSRAVSEGIPVFLWIDQEKGMYGLEREPGYADADNRAEEFTLSTGLRFEVPDTGTEYELPVFTASSLMAANDPRGNLPRIRFLPDGTIADTSPRIVRLVDDNIVVSLIHSRLRNQYEIATADEERDFENR
jgi:Tfp pilus assembly protein FimT